MREIEKGNNPFAEFLRNTRKENGWTLREVGIKTGLEPSFINRLEKGERINPSISTIQVLATAYKVEIIELINLVLPVLKREKENEKEPSNFH